MILARLEVGQEKKPASPERKSYRKGFREPGITEPGSAPGSQAAACLRWATGRWGFGWVHLVWLGNRRLWSGRVWELVRGVVTWIDQPLVRLRGWRDLRKVGAAELPECVSKGRALRVGDLIWTKRKFAVLPDLSFYKKTEN